MSLFLVCVLRFYRGVMLMTYGLVFYAYFSNYFTKL